MSEQYFEEMFTLDEEVIFSEIVKWAVTAAKYLKETPAHYWFCKDNVRILVDTIEYESVNRKSPYNCYDKGGESTMTQKWQYLLGTKPKKLHSYLSQFKVASTEIVTSGAVDMDKCNGPYVNHPGH